MKRRGYLTIDDSPSKGTSKLIDYLSNKKIPAILFVRGQLMEQSPQAIEYALKQGLEIGNHSYAHKAAGEMEPQEWVNDLELCDHLIEAAYARCNKKRTAKYYRFPYIDRGDGQKLERIDKNTVTKNKRIDILQQYLKEQDFHQPFKNMPGTYPHSAADCLYTFTARDWMLSNKHRGTQDIKTRDELLNRASEDPILKSTEHNHVVLLHDQDGMVDDAIALINYMIEELDFEFQSL